MPVKKNITYDPAIFKELGAFAKDPVDGFKPRDMRTLVRLMFHYTYIKEGRDFLNANLPRKGVPPATVKKNLEDEFLADFGLVKDSPLSLAITNAHLFGDEYVRLFEIKPRTQAEIDAMAAVEAKYEANIQIIMNAVHDETMGQVFSMAW